MKTFTAIFSLFLILVMFSVSPQVFGGSFDPPDPPGPSASPSPPLNLIVELSQSQAVLTWNLPQGAGDGPITGYKIEVMYPGDGLFSILELDTGNIDTTYTHKDNFIAGEEYVYRVSAANPYGTGNPSNEAIGIYYDPIPPNPPENLVVEAISNSEIDLSWGEFKKNTGPPPTHYLIEFETINPYKSDLVLDSKYFDVNEYVSGSTETKEEFYLHSELETASTYAYKVYAVNEYGQSKPAENSETTLSDIALFCEFISNENDSYNMGITLNGSIPKYERVTPIVLSVIDLNNGEQIKDDQAFMPSDRGVFDNKLIPIENYFVSNGMYQINISYNNIKVGSTICINEFDQMPIAVIDVISNPPYEINQDIKFSGINSNDPDGDKIIEYRWKLLEQSLSDSGPEVGYIYDRVGDYTVELIVINDKDQSATTTKVIEISLPVIEESPKDDDTDVDKSPLSVEEIQDKPPDEETPQISDNPTNGSSDFLIVIVIVVVSIVIGGIIVTKYVIPKNSTNLTKNNVTEKSETKQPTQHVEIKFRSGIENN